MNKVEIKFKDRIAINRDTYFLFTKFDAIDFVRECLTENIEILGIDGFYKIDNQTVQPSMENSIDFSSSDYLRKGSNIYDDSIIFINEKDENLFFEIVCSD